MKKYPILYLFNAYISDHEDYDFDEKALKHGICISKQAGDALIKQAIRVYGVKGFLLNQTLHKSFQIVVDSDQETLIFQQILHYMTTYGFRQLDLYDQDCIYIPKEQLDVVALKEDIIFKYIKPITINELKERLKKMMMANIALSENSIRYIKDLLEDVKFDLEEINQVKNKELKCILYQKYHIVPANADEFMRHLVYALTSNTMIVKNKSLIHSLKVCNKKKAYNILNDYMNEYGLIPLAQVFNRYKELLIALKDKRYTELNRVINKISHLSKKHHQPMHKNDLNDFLNYCLIHENDDDFEIKLSNKLKKAGMFVVVRLLNYLKQKENYDKNQLYRIRNGKVWINMEKAIPIKSCIKAKKILEQILVEHLQTKVENKKVYLPTNLEIALPQSEKQYVSNIPCGSYVNLGKHDLVVGIHWLNNDHNEQVDLDLKVLNERVDIGWNSSYNESDDLIFSGDITDAPSPNGASEFIYVSKTCEEMLLSLKVNIFNTVKDVKYDFIIAYANKEDLCENMIVNPNQVIMQMSDCEFVQGKKEKFLGCIQIEQDQIRFILDDFSTCANSVSRNSYLEQGMREYLKMSANTKCMLKEYLVKANAIIVEDVNDADLDYSLNKLSKDTFIDLLS